MASSNTMNIPIILCLFLCFAFLTSESTTPILKPNRLILPVQKDSATGLHLTYIHKRTPSKQLPFVVDLNNEFLWVNCEKNYLSSTFNVPQCHSNLCNQATAHYCRACPHSASRPGCHNNACAVRSFNPVTRQSYEGELAQDVFSIQSSQGSSPGPMYQISSFLFGCAPPELLQKGLPRSAAGIAGFAHTAAGLPRQIASHFGFQPKFAMCLSPGKTGGIFFGEGPYSTLSGVDVSRAAETTSTPLLVNAKGEYFVGVKSIRINNRAVPLNATLLAHNERIPSGTKISTTVPYTVLERSIYTAVVQEFSRELVGEKQVRSVGPFGLCYQARSGLVHRVPAIDMVMTDQKGAWRIRGENAMVEARKGVTCLGFVDGGRTVLDKERAAVVIGLKQLEDNLVQFDLAKSRVGFSSSLLAQGTSCSKFNFPAPPRRPHDDEEEQDKLNQ